MERSAKVNINLGRIELFGFVALLIVGSQGVMAHGGGLDKYGCHNNRKVGNYHCHQGPFAGRTFSSQSEMLRELNKK